VDETKLGTFPCTYKRREEQIIASSMEDLVGKGLMPTTFFIAALQVNPATGRPANGYRYVEFGVNGRINFRYDVFRHVVEMKAVVRSSVSKPDVYRSLQSQDAIINGIKAGDIVEQYDSEGRSTRKFYKVLRWCKVFIPSQHEFTDRSRSTFSSASEQITVELQCLEGDSLREVSGLELELYRKLCHPFRGLLKDTGRMLLFSDYDLRKNIERERSNTSAIIRGIVQIITFFPLSFWAAELLSYDKSWGPITGEVVTALEQHLNLVVVEHGASWMNRVIATVTQWCPEMSVAFDTNPARTKRLRLG